MNLAKFYVELTTQQGVTGQVFCARSVEASADSGKVRCYRGALKGMQIGLRVLSLFSSAKHGDRELSHLTVISLN